MEKKLLILLLILNIPFSFPSASAKLSPYSAPVSTSSGGSSYQLYFETDTLNWQLGKSYLFKVGIVVLSFDNDVSNFYDIALKVLLTDGSNFEILASSSPQGTVYTKNEPHSNIWSVDITDKFPLTFSVFVGSVFKEAVSIATDPMTEDGWTKIADISTETENFVPTIDRINDINYTVGDTANFLTWVAYDENPSNYTISRDGLSVASGTWNSRENITISIDGLDPGTYTYTLKVLDENGLNATDTVIVTVKEKLTSKDSSTPFLLDSFIISILIIGLLGKLLKKKKEPKS